MLPDAVVAQEIENVFHPRLEGHLSTSWEVGTWVWLGSSTSRAEGGSRRECLSKASNVASKLL